MMDRGQRPELRTRYQDTGQSKSCDSTASPGLFIVEQITPGTWLAGRGEKVVNNPIALLGQTELGQMETKLPLRESDVSPDKKAR